MNERENKSLLIVESLSIIFNIKDENKKDLFENIKNLSEDDFLSMKKMLNEYNIKQNEVLKKLRTTIKLWGNQIEELIEKADIEKESEKLFKDL